MAWREDEAVEVDYPNRDKATSKATKATVLLLLLASAALTLIITVGGWEALTSWRIVQIIFAALFLLYAFYVARWKGGVLPVAAATALIFGIFAVIAVPAWLDRDNPGFAQPGLPAGVIALLTVILVIVQVLLIVFSMRGFQQAWGVEVERGRRGGRLDEDDAVAGANRREQPAV